MTYWHRNNSGKMQTHEFTTKVLSFLRRRDLWGFVRSNVWLDQVRITNGRMLTSLLSHLDKLVFDNHAIVYQTVKYTFSNNVMKEFLRRGSVMPSTLSQSKTAPVVSLCKG